MRSLVVSIPLLRMSSKFVQVSKLFHLKSLNVHTHSTSNTASHTVLSSDLGVNRLYPHCREMSFTSSLFTVSVKIIMN